MNGTSVKMTAMPSVNTRSRWRIPARILTTLIALAIVGFIVREISIVLDRSPDPAGFTRGLLQGALMPAALPNLVVGSNVVIYADNNTGVPYKLGYTLGVNLCGAIFFGMFYLRLSRWRKRRRVAG